VKKGNNMKTIWILGAGKFGRRAVHKLHSSQPDARIMLVDRDRSLLEPFESGSVETCAGDAIEYLCQHLGRQKTPDWIVPAVPLHVAFEWIKSVLKHIARVKKLGIPQALINHLPCIPAHEPGKIYISLADFICPDDCCEPDKYCTVTGKPRPYDLYQKLSQIRIENFHPVVIRSRQLAPGLGGYRPKTLFEALDRVQSADSPILLGTACRCHGVLDAFAVIGHQ